MYELEEKSIEKENLRKKIKNTEGCVTLGKIQSTFISKHSCYGNHQRLP